VGSYYYLVAQLPALSYGAPAPLGAGDFIELCRNLMEDSDKPLLRECALDPAGSEQTSGDEAAYARLSAPTHSALIDGWRAWERALRLNLARLRSQRLKRDTAALTEPPVDPLDAATVAKAALTMESPLEGELYLDRARWDAIESLQGFDYFGRDTVYAYLLKLLLLERRAQFKAEEGFSEYKALYASIMEAAPTSNPSGEPK